MRAAGCSCCAGRARDGTCAGLGRRGSFVLRSGRGGGGLVAPCIRKSFAGALWKGR